MPDRPKLANTPLKTLDWLPGAQVGEFVTQCNPICLSVATVPDWI